MNDPNKQPTLTGELLSKCRSEEATREIVRIEAEYKKAELEMEHYLTIRHGNMFMAKQAGIVTPEFEKLEKSILDDFPKRLKKEYLAKAEEVYYRYHPKDHETEFGENMEDIYARGFNYGYLLAKEEPDISQLLTMSIKEISSPFTDGMNAGNVRFHEESIKEKFLDNAKEIAAEKTPNREVDADKDKKTYPEPDREP